MAFRPPPQNTPLQQGLKGANTSSILLSASHISTIRYLAINCGIGLVVFEKVFDRRDSFFRLPVRSLSAFFLGLLVSIPTVAALPVTVPLTPVPVEQGWVDTRVGFDREVWDHRELFLKGMSDNLRYLESASAEAAYEKLKLGGLSRELIAQSLVRFKEILSSAESFDQFHQAVQDEFMLYRSEGRDGRGTVKFTGYFQPTYRASRRRTMEYQFPLYGMPANFSQWKAPHPTRVQLEGYDGKSGLMRGHEVAWLRSRYEVFMVQIQGSALLRMTDGTEQAVGFAAGTNYPFRGVSKSFLEERRISWNELRTYFASHPEELNRVMARNNRVIFFSLRPHPLPIGSLGVPVLPERAIATDKQVLPPGALGLISTRMPVVSRGGQMRITRASRIVLDQDTGKAITGAGRVDIFMGTGPEAQQKASSVFADGELYYLVLKGHSGFGMNS
jgi:membrane-bound lytic murein transglycosylase A